MRQNPFGKSGMIAMICSFMVGAVTGMLIMRASLPNGESVRSEDLEPSLTRGFAENLVISQIDMEAVPLPEAVDYLRSKSRTGVEVDGLPPPFRLNFVVVDPKRLARPVDLKLKSVRLDRVCERIAQAAGVRVAFDTDAIVFSSEAE
ncbi:hypothetical protein [Luteolibacter yonseiensis]